jgi:hypothetical protein
MTVLLRPARRNENERNFLDKGLSRKCKVASGMGAPNSVELGTTFCSSSTVRDADHLTSARLARRSIALASERRQVGSQD